jgi:quercetin dioxygenase-like cupin family protein
MIRRPCSILAVTFLVVAAVAWPRPLSLNTGIATPISKVQFEQDKDVKCLSYALETADSATGASTHILRTSPKCLIPWHYHAAQEQLIVIHGTVLTEMEGMSATAFGPGGFAMMPSMAKHQFSCESSNECLIVATFDRRYNIVWVKGTPNGK